MLKVHQGYDEDVIRSCLPYLWTCCFCPYLLHYLYCLPVELRVPPGSGRPGVLSLRIQVRGSDELTCAPAGHLHLLPACLPANSWPIYSARVPLLPLFPPLLLISFSFLLPVFLLFLFSVFFFFPFFFAFFLFFFFFSIFHFLASSFPF